MATLPMVRPWKDPKTGIYFFRKRIPTRFLAVLGRKPGTQYKATLGTRDPKAAKAAMPQAQAAYDAQEAEWEKLLHAEALTPERTKEIAARWVAWFNHGGSLDMGAEDDSVFAPWVEKSLRTPDNMARMNARIEFHTEEALKLAGISVTHETHPLLLHEMALPTGCR